MSKVKWLSISGVGAALLAGGFYFAVPDNIDNDIVMPAKAASGDYSRTLYGVPDIKFDHYRIDEDSYFDLQIDGVLNIGRVDPAEHPVWKKRVDALEKNIPKSDKKSDKNAYYKALGLQEDIYSVVEGSEYVAPVKEEDTDKSEKSDKGTSNEQEANDAVDGLKVGSDKTSEAEVDPNDAETSKTDGGADSKSDDTAKDGSSDATEESSDVKDAVDMGDSKPVNSEESSK